MFRAWHINQSGSVAMMNGLMFIMLVGATGGAVDYTSATNKRASLQDAADASVLAAASLPLADDAARIAHAQKVFVGSGFCERNACTTPTVTISNGAVVLTTTSQVKTTLLQVVGMDAIDIGVDSRALPSNVRPVEVAMILDYSGSMNTANKVQNMATAATDFWIAPIRCQPT